jgi:hypothetical protein
MYPNGSRGNNQPTSPTKKQHVRGGGKKTPSQGTYWNIKIIMKQKHIQATNGRQVQVHQAMLTRS